MTIYSFSRFLSNLTFGESHGSCMLAVFITLLFYRMSSKETLRYSMDEEEEGPTPSRAPPTSLPPHPATPLAPRRLRRKRKNRGGPGPPARRGGPPPPTAGGGNRLEMRFVNALLIK